MTVSACAPTAILVRMRTRLPNLVLVGALVGAGACGDSGADPTPYVPDASLHDARVPDARVPDAGGPDARIILEPDAQIGPVDAGFDAPTIDIDADTTDASPFEDDADIDAATPVGSRFKFVINGVHLPTTSAQTRDLAHNIDGDANNRPDNAFGGILSALTQQGIDVNAANSAAIASGDNISLQLLQADNLLNSVAFWSVFQGSAQPNPDYSGNGSFTIDPAAPTDSLLPGHILGGEFAGGPGKARVKLMLLGAPIVVDLIGARVSTTLSASGCSGGKIGGGISQQSIQNQVFPALAGGFSHILAADPGCPSMCSGQALTLENLFDTDHNGTITTAEIANNTLVHALFAPDVDLVDASGAFNPLHDGVKDSLSIGFGFTCVAASYAAPGD